VHHGIWDYDFPAAPTLVDLTVDGKRIQALAQVSKQGFVYVLDRRTGTPVWPIEERPVPPSTVPGERASLTQPFPTKPPPFERQGLTDDNILDYTPELRQRALEIANRYDRGPLFTPPSERGTIQLPGNAGGANWMGAAFDPETGRLYVPSNSNPYLVQIVKQDANRTNFTYSQGPATLPTLEGIPIVKPPYGRLTAYDLNQGTLLWQVPLGDGPRNHPLLAALKLGPLGGGRPFILATKTLLFASTRGFRLPGDPTPQPESPALVALDKASGDTVWKATLSAPSSAPMTYLHGGKQYVAMAIGGGRSAEIVAYALQ
jgi:quinoprotein glucose dehydrogenase